MYAPHQITRAGVARRRARVNNVAEMAAAWKAVGEAFVVPKFAGLVMFEAFINEPFGDAFAVENTTLIRRPSLI